MRHQLAIFQHWALYYMETMGIALKLAKEGKRIGSIQNYF